jgi:hypothetical protein
MLILIIQDFLRIIRLLEYLSFIRFIGITFFNLIIIIVGVRKIVVWVKLIFF